MDLSEIEELELQLLQIPKQEHKVEFLQNKGFGSSSVVINSFFEGDNFTQNIRNYYCTEDE